MLEEIVLDMLGIHIKKMVDTQELAARIKDITVDYNQVLFQDLEIEKMKEEQKKFLNIDKLDRMALVTFVDRILIFEDKTIQIVFKYQNEFDKAKVVADSLDLEVV